MSRSSFLSSGYSGEYRYHDPTRFSSGAMARNPVLEAPSGARNNNVVRLNGERFRSLAEAKSFALRNLPVNYQWPENEDKSIEMLSTEDQVNRFFFPNMSVDGLVMRRAGCRTAWELSNPGLAALGMRRGDRIRI